MKTNSTGNSEQHTSQTQSHDPLQQRLSTVANSDLNQDANQDNSVQDGTAQAGLPQETSLQDGTSQENSGHASLPQDSPSQNDLPQDNPPQEDLQPIDPLSNSAFIRIFGAEESKGFVREFVNLVFDKVGLEPIDQITRIEAEHSIHEGSIECKTPRVDIQIVTDGRIVDLEAQNYPADIDSKSVMYATHLMAESMRTGASYTEMPQVVVVMLLSARMQFPQSEEFVSISKMAWRTSSGKELGQGSDRIIFVLVELDKIRKRYNNLNQEVLGDELLSWLYLLVRGYRDDTEVEAITMAFPTIEQFAKQYGYATNDPSLKKAYETALWNAREEDSFNRYIAKIKQEAAEEALEKGLAEDHERIRLALLAKGIDEQEVNEILA